MKVWLYKRIKNRPWDKAWYVGFYQDGKRKSMKIGDVPRKVAENIKAKIIVELAEGTYLDKKKKERVLFKDFYEKDFLKYIKTRCRPKTIKMYEISFRNLLPLFGDRDLSEITPLLIEHFRNKRIKEVKPRTVNVDIGCLKHMFNKAIEWKIVSESPVKNIKRLKESNRRVRCLTPEEVKRLIEECPPYLKRVCMIALLTGLRKEEILTLKWKENIDFRNRQIVLNQTKGSGENSEYVPMNESLVNLLKGIKRHPTSPFVICKENGEPYTWIKKGFRAAVEKAGIKDFRFHDLRHTYASLMIMQVGVDPSTLKELMRHKSLDMVERYSHLFKSHKQRVQELWGKKLDAILGKRVETLVEIKECLQDVSYLYSTQ